MVLAATAVAAANFNRIQMYNLATDSRSSSGWLFSACCLQFSASVPISSLIKFQVNC